MKDLPRGLRLRNPGNLEHGEPWQGLTADQPDPRFCQFDSLEFGYRGLARTLMSYGKRGLVTPRAIARVYAPQKENPTEAYAAMLAEFCRCDVEDRLDLHDVRTLTRLCYAITVMENLGAIISRGVHMALGE